MFFDNGYIDKVSSEYSRILFRVRSSSYSYLLTMNYARLEKTCEIAPSGIFMQIESWVIVAQQRWTICLSPPATIYIFGWLKTLVSLIDFWTKIAPKKRSETCVFFLFSLSCLVVGEKKSRRLCRGTRLRVAAILLEILLVSPFLLAGFLHSLPSTLSFCVAS